MTLSCWALLRITHAGLVGWALSRRLTQKRLRASNSNFPQASISQMSTHRIVPRITEETGLVKTAFISGPLDLDQAYFSTHYIPLITMAIQSNDAFVLGPSRGIDSFAFQYLLSSNVASSRITVYLALSQRNQRRRFSDFEAKGGRIVVVERPGHTARDEACTRASHYDILRYRSKEEQRVLYGAGYRERLSGTEKNEIRRKNGVGLIWKECL